MNEPGCDTRNGGYRRCTADPDKVGAWKRDDLCACSLLPRSLLLERDHVPTLWLLPPLSL